MNDKQLRLIVWLISAISVVLAVVAWGGDLQWNFGYLSTYSLFPLFGLVAFSLMWSHYMAAMLRRLVRAEASSLARYFEITSLAVLAAILLHPGLLLWQLWRDGLGLPPGSVRAYTGPLYGAALLGVIALVLFMAYELRRKFKTRSWWKYVQNASDFAMFLILIHALRLGSNLQQGWFRGVWYFYGLSLLVALVYNYLAKRRKNHRAIA